MEKEVCELGSAGGHQSLERQGDTCRPGASTEEHSPTAASISAQ